MISPLSQWDLRHEILFGHISYNVVSAGSALQATPPGWPRQGGPAPPC